MPKDIEITLVPSAELNPYANNPKEHTSGQVKKIAKAISDFGFNVPLVITSDKEVVAGHGRLLAAKQLELKDVPCIVIDHLTPAQVRAFRIADNRLTESSWLNELLANEVKELAEKKQDLYSLGFSYEELAEILDVAGASFLLPPEEESGARDGLPKELVITSLSRGVPQVVLEKGNYVIMDYMALPQHRDFLLKALKRGKRKFKTETLGEALVKIAEWFIDGSPKS